ncbi:citrate transporter [Enterococcus faecium E980]|uniref:SLC13 family permease n=2 Tax=Enterococcus TaxID=1350 RepID=UPI0001CEAC8A|nr:MULTISPECIES: SLC13 family permease [Enterococcus]EFF37451.1 citrate transporter [Enterococcus faecium E980]MCA6747739.1 citrate transporter [Enterococcus lactis]MDB7509115.1 SLC13 family permease [Enterococcus faecium]MDB7517055.1 SLC13 family permease [Enterococcus faecium]MDG4564550.1 SLC13 family permease [Enterococcus lactis]
MKLADFSPILASWINYEKMVEGDYGMSYLAILGFAMMGVITFLLMKDKLNILVCFAILPLVFSFLSGADLSKTTEHIISGLDLTRSIFLMIMFSLPYFALMTDAGLFEILIYKVLKKMKIGGPILCSFTVPLAILATLDGSVMSTYLIVIPLLLPLFKKLKIDPMILVFLTSLGTMHVFLKLIPLMILMTILTMIFAYFLGKKSQKRNGFIKKNIEAGTLVGEEPELSEMSRPKLFWFNLCLTIAVVTLLIVTSFPEFYIFAVGLILALVINYPDRKMQNKLVSKYAAATYPIAPIVFMSGVVVGVLEGTGMMEQMVMTLVEIVPSSMGPYLHIIIALLNTPLMFIFTNDTWYFALVPIITAVGEQYGVAADIIVLALFFNVGAFASIVAQPQIIMACDLGGETIREYIRFSFFKLWGISIVWTLVGFAIGIF